ncbi:protein unc-93 homolog A-like isoform X2 [Ptychodera flava]
MPSIENLRTSSDQHEEAMDQRNNNQQAFLAEHEEIQSYCDSDNSEHDKSGKRTQESKEKPKTWLIWKNTLCLSIAYFLLFGAYMGLQILQSSINCVAGLGFVSLVVVYACMLFSGLFSPPLVIGWLGVKRTIVLSMIPYIVFTAANFKPQWYTMIPASAIVGLAAPIIWTAQGIYVATAGRKLSAVTGKPSDLLIRRKMTVFFGIAFLSSPVFLLVPSFIYSSDSPKNETGPSLNHSFESQATCGASDCQEMQGNKTTFCDPPDKNLTNILLGFYLSMGFAAVATVVFLVDQMAENGMAKQVTLKKL